MNTWTATRRLLLALSLVAVAPGCRRGAGEPDRENPTPIPVVAALDAPPGEIVLAQGQLEPAGGVVAVVAPAGDRIESILVTEGQSVTAGMVVGRLAGHALRMAELAVAEAHLGEGRARAKAERALAEAKLAVARVGTKKNELQLAQARAALDRATAEGGELELLDRRVALAEEKLEQLREAARQPGGRQLVSETAIRQQELVTEAARTERESARRDAQSAVEAAGLVLEASQAELQAAELQIESAAAMAPLESLEKEVELLRLQVSAAELTSPIDGVVLAIDMAKGQPTSGSPAMRIADTSEMVCRSEVPVAELGRIKIGAPATIGGAGLDRILSGNVTSVSQLIGTPRLPNPNPLMNVDWRAAMVVISIDADDVGHAAARVQAQVDVAIRAAPE